MLSPKFRNMVSAKAFETAQIAIVFGGYDQAELVRHLAFSPIRGEKLNVITVYRILDEMRESYVASR